MKFQFDTLHAYLRPRIERIMNYYISESVLLIYGQRSFDTLINQGGKQDEHFWQFTGTLKRLCTLNKLVLFLA